MSIFRGIALHYHRWLVLGVGSRLRVWFLPNRVGVWAYLSISFCIRHRLSDFPRVVLAGFVSISRGKRIFVTCVSSLVKDRVFCRSIASCVGWQGLKLMSLRSVNKQNDSESTDDCLVAESSIHDLHRATRVVGRLYSVNHELTLRLVTEAARPTGFSKCSPQRPCRSITCRDITLQSPAGQAQKWGIRQLPAGLATPLLAGSFAHQRPTAQQYFLVPPPLHTLCNFYFPPSSIRTDAFEPIPIRRQIPLSRLNPDSSTKASSFRSRN